MISTPTSITWTIDGSTYATANQNALVAGSNWADAYSYGNYHLILDLAVGGWPCDAPNPCGPQSSPQPYTMTVQWVKWYQ